MFTYKSRRIATALVLAAFSTGAWAAGNLFDDFSSGSLSNSRWWRPEGIREIDQTAEKLVMTARHSGVSDAFCESCMRLQLIDPSVTALQADIAITEADVGTGGTKWVFGRVAGYFYNASNETPGLAGSSGYEGDVFAATAIGDRGNGLEAWWEVTRYTNEVGDEAVKTTGSLIPPGTLQLGEEYTATITYDGDASFIFTVDGVSSGNVAGPPRTGDAIFLSKRLNAGVYTGAPSGDGIIDTSDIVFDDGSPGFVRATFDNVTVNNQIAVYDDFSGPVIDQALWIETRTSREIVDGKLRTELSGQGDFENARNFLTDFDANLVEAKVTLLGSSDIPAGTRGRVRLDGTWYNRLYDGNYNGYEGDVYAHIAVEKLADETLRAAAYAEAINDPDYTDITQLMFESFTRPVAFDTEYTLSIEVMSDKLVFTFDGEVIEHPITTNVYPPSTGLSWKTLRGRLQEGPGTLHFLIDDVRTDNETPVADAGADATVRPGETVTLTAVVSDEDPIDAYFWEQIGGTAVTPATVGPAMVTPGQSVSFAAPATEEALTFELTAIDRYGASGTSTVTVTTEEDSDSGSGSSALGLWFLLCLMIGGVCRRRLQFQH